MSDKTNEDHLQRVRSIGPVHLIIDGSLLVARMAYATELSPVFLDGDETDMNGVSGFLEEIEVVREIFPSIREVHVVWEGGGRAMRRAIFPEYKAQRDKPSKGSDYMRARVFPAKKLLRDRILPRTPFHQVEPRRWEGDDGMGTLSKVLADRGVPSLILSNDHDLLQLLDGDLVSVLQSKKNSWIAFTEERLLEDEGITPLQLVDVKALAGDSSDNYKGVPRIGDKTAIKLLIEHGSLDEIIRVARSEGKLLGKENWARLICEHVEDTHVGRALATIRRDAELVRISTPPNSFDRFDELVRALKLHHLEGLYS